MVGTKRWPFLILNDWKRKFFCRLLEIILFAWWSVNDSNIWIDKICNMFGKWSWYKSISDVMKVTVDGLVFLAAAAVMRVCNKCTIFFQRSSKTIFGASILGWWHSCCQNAHDSWCFSFLWMLLNWQKMLWFLLSFCILGIFPFCLHNILFSKHCVMNYVKCQNIATHWSNREDEPLATTVITSEFYLVAPCDKTSHCIKNNEACQLLNSEQRSAAQPSV